MQILSPASFCVQPWKNGGGITHEILRWPDREDYDVRISLAEDRVPAPFSTFPGYRRWSYLAGPAPIVLHAEGAVHTLAALGDGLAVDGLVAIRCELPAGPTRLLNFLVRKDLPLQPGRGPCDHPVQFVFALEDLPWLPRDHAAVLDPAKRLDLNDCAIWLG